jgi:hypothetical protein
MSSAIPPFTPEESAELVRIWDRLYELYLEQANGSRDAAEVQAEVDALINKRNAIRPWGWNTGRNWKDDIPKDIADKLIRE